MLKAVREIDLPTSPVQGRSDDDRRWLVVGQYVLGLLGVGLATAVGLGLQGFIPSSSLALLYVLPVIATAISFGWGPSIGASVAGALAFDFFFTTPVYSLRVADAGEFWSIALLLVIAAIVAALAAQSRGRALRASRMVAQAEALQALAHAVMVGAPQAQVIERAATTLSQAFGAPAFILANRGGMDVLAASGRPVPLRAADYEAAQAALDAGAATHAGLYPAEGARLDFWPIPLPDGQRWVIGVDFTRIGDARPAGSDGLVESVATCLAASFRY